jgi:hypothetical protein
VPDLVFRRDGTHPPVKPACMYCGRPATRTRSWDVENPRLDPPHGVSRFRVRPGDDFGCFAVVFLPMLLVELVGRLSEGRTYREALATAAPLVPASTTVTLTTCDRHHRFGRRWGWVVAGWFAALAVSWGLLPLLRTQPGGAPLWLFALLIVTTLAAPLILLLMWGEHGPIHIDRVGRESATLTRVRKAYFDAPG